MGGDELAWVALRTSARRLGALAWSEQRVSSVLAGLVPDSEDDELCLVLASLGRRCTARSEVVVARMPELSEFPVDDLVRPAGPAWQDVVDAFDDGSVTAILAGLGRSVLPRLAEAYRALAATASPVSEPSVRRHLGPLEADVARDAGLARAMSGGASELPGLAGLLSRADVEGGVLGR